MGRQRCDGGHVAGALLVAFRSEEEVCTMVVTNRMFPPSGYGKAKAKPTNRQTI